MRRMRCRRAGECHHPYQYLYIRSKYLVCDILTSHILYSSGGLVIVGGQGKIDINNTFDERLLLLQSSGLPAVRETLFGKNPNRKFYD